MLRDHSLDNMGFNSTLPNANQVPQYQYAPSSSLRYSDRPRPSSARDPVYADLLENAYYSQTGVARIRAPNANTLHSPYDGRPSSMERGSNYPSGGRGYYGGFYQKYSRATQPMSAYGVQHVPYQPPTSNFPSQHAMLNQSQRRAQSYEMNLEKQGLYEYNTALASAGVGQNQSSHNMYGNMGSGRIDGIESSLQPMTPVIGYSNSAGIQNANFGGYGMSGSSGVMTMSNSVDVVNMQRECVRLHQELDMTKEKLNACMTSIRTFWSPELKRERAMRKEENAKYAILADHLHQLQLEKQTMLQALHNSDAELRRERDLHSSRFKHGVGGDLGSAEASELEMSRCRIDELTCENRILAKTMEEVEKRSSNLQTSLTATEESLRRLVEAVKTGKAGGGSSAAGQNKENNSGGAASGGNEQGFPNIRVDRLESDRQEIERLRDQLNEAYHRGSEAEKALIECDMQRSQLKEELENFSSDLDVAKHDNETMRLNIRETQTLQAIVDTKESKILTLENEIRLLEDEIARLRDEGIATPTTSMSSGIEDVDRTLNAFRSNERLLKSKVEFLTSEVSKRESEIYALQSRLEMTEKQQQDQNHHISVLKEQVKARENKVTMLTADLEDFRKRLKEKEGLLEKKAKMAVTNATGKRQLETEVTELKDQIDLKERKIALLQRKIENLEEMVSEKEAQLVGAKSRLSRLSTEKTGSEGSKANLEDALKEKDRQIERLKESRQRLETESVEEMEAQKRLQSDMRSRLELVLRELDEKTAQLTETRDEMAQLRNQRYKRDIELSQLQAQLGQRDAEISSMQLEKQMLQKQMTTETEVKYAKTIADLESQVNHYTESASKLQTEVDRLLNMIRNSDSDKIDKDNQIHELEEQIHEAQSQIGSLKRAQQADRKKHTQLLDEARQRSDVLQTDSEVLRNMMSEKEVRVRELEQALRESVRLTAEREAHVASREDTSRQMEQQVRELRSNLEHLQRERNNLSAQLASLQEELRDREGLLKNLENDCFQGYIPELDKLRKSNQDANLRVAALVKLVQGHEDHLTEQERSILSTIPLFPGLVSKLSFSVSGTKNQSRTWGPGSQLASAPAGAYGGASSPHFTGSAFQLIGSNSAANAAALSVGGISMPGQSSDSILLGRLLHEKETILQQQLQDLTRLRFQNSEMEVRLKSLQRDFESKTNRLNSYEAANAMPMGMSDWQTAMLAGGGCGSGMHVSQAELATLRQANTEMREKINKLQSSLQERENELHRINLSHTSAATLEIERLKLELENSKDERDSIEKSLRLEISQMSDDVVRVNSNVLSAESQLKEKKDKIRLLEFEQVKAKSDMEGLQKKYHTVLGQLTELTDKLQKVEHDCQQNHTQELQRLKTEGADLSHRVSYLHKGLQEREEKLEQQETLLSKQKNEFSAVKKQAHSLEAELKNLREEVAYKDERSRQLQIQHADELARMRSMHQELSSKLSHLQLDLDEKDHELKSINGDLEKYKSELDHTKSRLKETETERNQNSVEIVQKTDRCRALELECQGQSDEIVRLQASLEDGKSKMSILQKRVDEREQRLRKIEGENHDLLDEIHALRKRNHELESHIDVLRQRLLDRDEGRVSTVPPTSNSPSLRLYQSATTVEKSSSQLIAEMEKLRKQNVELETSNSKNARAVEDLQIQFDQLSYERNNLSKLYDEEREKRIKFESSAQTKDDQPMRSKSVIPESSMQSPAQIKELTLTVNQLKRDIERRDSQLKQLTQQVEQAEKLSKLSSSGSDRDALLAELRVSLQRTQSALDQACEQNQILQARSEASILESQQQFLIQRQNLQEQIATLQQNLHDASLSNDKIQKELRQSSTRVQDLTRQLRETQTNCDSIASQRDGLQSRIEQLQQSGMRGGLVYGSGGAMRPASVAAGYSDMLPNSSLGMSSTGQLSKELDRLHREQETARNQLEQAERMVRMSKNEAENARGEVSRLKEELEHQREITQELQDNLEAREEEMTKKNKFEIDKFKKQHLELNTQLANLQKQVTAKDTLIEQLTNQLKTMQENCAQLEEKLTKAAHQIESLDTQQEQVSMERNQQQRLSFELDTVKKELSLRETQFNQLTQKFNQSLKDASDQSHVINELSRQLETAKATAQQSAHEAETAQRQAAAWANDQIQAQQTRLQSVSSEQNQRDRETVEALKADLKTALEARDKTQQMVAKLESDLNKQRQALDTSVDRYHELEDNCQQEHLSVIARLTTENQELRHVVEKKSSLSSVGEGTQQALKQEVDMLKKELSKRDGALSRLEKDCQEKHVRKLEALQVQLRRYEEETENLNRVLEEQRGRIEERDLLIRQLKANGQTPGKSEELEKLKSDHARCDQQIQQKQQQLETLMKQLEEQAVEILSTKLEALTASLCEKDANIALIQTSGAHNATANQAVKKLHNERDLIQTQMKQLTFARDALAEQRQIR